MAPDTSDPGSIWGDVAARATERADEWIAALGEREDAHPADLLGGMRRDPESFEFTRKLLELVAGTEDAFASALGLREMAQDVPASMPVRDRIAVRAGGAASLGLPWAIMPMARRWLRDRVSGLVLATKLPSGQEQDGAAKPGPGSGSQPRVPALVEALRTHADAGVVPVIRPLGEHVHGPQAAEAEVRRLAQLATVTTVGHMIVDPARIVPGGSEWSADDDVALAASRLRPLLAASAEHGTVVTLAPRSVRWARLLPDVLRAALGDPALDRARVGVGLLAELPESRELYDRVSRWAQRRVAEGGAPAEVLIGVGRVAGAERIESIDTGLAVPVIEEPREVRAQLLRLAELAVHPGRAAVLRPVIASEDPFVLGAVAELIARAGAESPGAAALASVQLRSGAAPGLAETIADSFSEVRVSLPVIPSREFSGAVETLVAFAAEAADPDSALALLERLSAERAAEVTAEVTAEAATDAAAEAAAPAGEGEPAAPDPDPATDRDPAPASAPVEAQAEQPAETFISVNTGVEVEVERADPDPEPAASLRPALAAAAREFAAAAQLAVECSPPSHRTQLRAREWDPTERDSALFYRAPEEPSRFDTGGLTAAVLGLTRGDTGEFQLEELQSPLAIPVVSESGFANEPQTDASIAANRDWVRGLLEDAAEEASARDQINETVALSIADLDPTGVVQVARETGERWGSLPHTARASRLRRAALAVVAARDRLIRALAADTGAPAPELDAEVDDLVDAARYAGQLAENLGAVRGAAFVSEGLVLVAADDQTPLATQAEAVLAALAAGNGVIWTVPQRVSRAAEVLVEEWQIAGITPGAVRLEATVVGHTVSEIAARPDIDRAVLLGDRDTARELSRRRPDLRVEGRFHARGAIVVAPSADLDSAVRDIVASALKGAGSDPRAAHVAILLGSVARSKRFREGLADAVRAIRVGDTARPEHEDPLGFAVGPLPAPPESAALRALTELGKGEEWLVRPRRLDEDGLLWTPGVRTGVAAGSRFWDDARGVPVIGIAHAHSMAEAIALQNAAGSGAVAGIQSFDDEEILAWLSEVSAATLAINRPTTEARIERQPGGGWGDATMGLPALSGGPNRLIPLGSWELREGTRSETLHLRGLAPEVRLIIEAAQPNLSYEDFDAVRRAALSDAIAWRTSYGLLRDAIGLGIERNALRYVPVATHVRLAEGGSIGQLVRVLAAALLVRAPVTVSTGELLPEEVGDFLERQGIEVSLERDDDWVERLAVSGPLGADGVRAERVRLIGGDAVRTAEWMGGLDRAALWAEPVTMAGPVELLTLLREQAISARAHRHGFATPAPGLDALIEEWG